MVAYDISGVELEGVDEYQYLDLNVKQGQDFGANKAIVLPNVVTRSFSIASVEVVFSNGISQSVVMPMKSLPQSEYLSSLLRNDELVKQYQIETSKNALYVPQKASNLWCCSCGEWNSNGSCTRCGVDFTVANKYLDPSLLEPKMAERIINEKQAREQQQQAAIEQEKLAKENQKRKKKKTSPRETDFYDLQIQGRSILDDYSYQEYIEVLADGNRLGRMKTYYYSQIEVTEETTDE